MRAFFLSACIYICIPATGNAQHTFKEIDERLSTLTHPDSIALALSTGAALARAQDHLPNWVSYTLEYISVSEHYLHAFTDGRLRSLWRDPANAQEAVAAVQYYSYMGYACTQSGDIPLAVQYYEQALTAHEKFNTARATLFDEILKPLGNHYLRIGDFARAQEILYRMHDWIAEYPHPDHTASVANFAGLMHKLKGDPAEAMRHYRAGLELSQAVPAIRGKIASNVSLLSSETGDDRTAEEYAHRAIDLLKGTRSQERDVNADLAVAYLIIAQVTLNRLDLAAAYDAINTALSYAASTDKRTYAKMCVVRGRILRLAGYPEEAMEEFNSAIRQFIPEFVPERPHDHPASTSLPAENTIFEAMEGKADALSDLYTHSGDPALLVSGVQAHRLALEAELRLRHELSTEVSRNLLAADSRRRTAKALATLARLQQVRPGENIAPTAYDLMEATKAITVLEELTRRHQESATIPYSVETELTSELRMRERELQMLRRADNPDTGRIIAAERAVSTLKLELAEVRTNTFSHLTEYARQPDTVRYQPVGGQVLITYFLQDDAGYAVVVRADGSMHFAQLEHVLQLRDSTQALVTMLHSRAAMLAMPEYFGERALYLYQRLIADVIGEHEEYASLVIVPDGILNYLPFEVLLSAYDPGMTYATMPYLIRNIAVQYAYSAGVLFLQQELISYNRGGIAFAPFDTDRRGVSELSYSIGEIAHGSRFGVERFSGKEATFTRFMAHAGQSRIIHLATHAGVDSLGVGHIEFADSTMLLTDVYYLPLRCRLAILSACESAFGTYIPGEGIQSFVRAFAMAGTQTILASHWRLNDAAGAEIIAGVYRHLSKAQPVSNALRQAKLDYLAHDDIPAARKAPHYWASMVMVGSDGKIERTGVIPWWVIVACIVTGFMILLVARRVLVH